MIVGRRGAWVVGVCAVWSLASCAPSEPQEPIAQTAEKLLVPAPEPGSNDQYGSAISTDGQTLIVGDNQTKQPLITGHNKGSVYVYTRDQNTTLWTLIQSIRPDDVQTVSELEFGEGVNLVGNTLFVDSPRDALPNNDGEQGSVVVFTRTGPGQPFTQVSKVTEQTPVAGDRFGGTSASNGNFLAAAAVPGSAPGVSVYSLQGGNATFRYQVNAADTVYGLAMTQAGVLVVLAKGTTFAYHLDTNAATAVDTSKLPALPYQHVAASGGSIALLDPGNGGTVVVAGLDTARVNSAASIPLNAPSTTQLPSIAYREGKAIVVPEFDPSFADVLLLQPSGASYAITGPIYPPVGERLNLSDTFGQGLALSDDFVAVGDEAGAVHVLPLETNASTNGATFEQQQLTLRDSCPTCTPGDVLAANFGNAVGIENNVAVATETILVDPSSRVSAAHIYTRQASGSWTDSAEPALGGLTPRDVSVKSGRVYIGQGKFVPPGSFSSGSVRVVEQVGGQWQTTGTMTATDDGSVASKFIGDSISINGDVAAVGAFQSVYIFSRNADGSWTQVTKIADDPRILEQEGIARKVALSDNYLVVTAELDNRVGPHQGSAFVYKRSDWSLEQKLQLTASLPDNIRFGRAVAAEGSTIMIGENGLFGRIEVFERTGTGATPWLNTAEISPTNGGDYGVGTSISLSGDHMLVGANNDQISAFQGGAAYLFNRVNGLWNTAQANVLLPTDDTANTSAFFGWSVALSGDRALVGAPKRVNGGSAYVYEGLVDADHDGVLAADDCNDSDGLGLRCARALSFQAASGNLSFEQLSAQAWTASSGSFTADTVHHTDGVASFNIGAGPVRISSPNLATATLHEVGTALALDVFRTAATSDAVTLFMSAPALGISQSVIGSVDLSNLPLNHWQTVSAPIPGALREILLHQNTNVTFQLFFNRGGPGLFIDRLHFTGDFARHVVPALNVNGFSAAFTVTSDWGAGYCVALNLSNASTVATSGWQLAFDSQGTTLNNSWNAAFNGTSGIVTIANNQPWNAVVPPGASHQDVSVGFCATRPVGNLALPVITSVAAH